VIVYNHGRFGGFRNFAAHFPNGECAVFYL